ncbi:methyl-accepting chemotaxis protein [Tropicibacter alexandrii]|uniref:methyl-accepting chemotaxis protein n=1 Tax=Tropicibacter alexandrii TaxID=2267683 RepID=UPI000EF4F83F|nr:methyl-accepting chemotaxis protein [Tropicibacter alexandrii]
MGRFKIRTQAFFMAGALIVAMMGMAGISWFASSSMEAGIKGIQSGAEVDDFLMHEQITLLEAETHLMRFSLGAAESWDKFQTRMEDTIEGLTGEEAQAISAEMVAIGETLKQVRDFYPLLQEAATPEAVRWQAFQVTPLLSEASLALEALGEITDAATEQAAVDANLRAAQAHQLLMLVTLAAVAVALGVSWLFGTLLSRPIRKAVATVECLVREDYDCVIDGQERKDEVGMIVRSLETLRDRLRDGKQTHERIKQENSQRVDLFQSLGHAMSRLKGGALSSRIEADDWQDLGDSYVKLCDDFNDLATTLEDLVGSLNGSVETVRGNARDLSDMSTEMSRRAEVQAATLEESAAALDELSESVQSSAQRAEEMDLRVLEGRRRAEQGGVVMGQALEAMGSIARSSEQITQIIDVIDDIAFQTNLLALNAGVEAARAGESGKGFAVVASEVRQLAQRAAESANEIKELVLNSTTQVEDGERLVQQTSEMLTEIVQSVTDVSEMVSQVATSSREQASGVKEINIGVAELDKVTQQNAAMVGETSAASLQLNQEAGRLAELLARFSGGTAPTARITADETLFDMPEPEVAQADAGQADAAREARERELLLHGSWEGDMPEPTPVEFDEPLKVSNGTQWKDF